MILYLKICEALRAGRLIQGLIVAVKEDLILTELPLKELMEKLEMIGSISQ